MKDQNLYSVYEYNRTSRETGEQLGKDLPIDEADKLAMEQAHQIKEVEALDGEIKRVTKGENCVFDICGEDESIIVVCKYPTREYPTKKEAI